MESTGGLDGGWNIATNWDISEGSLDTSVTVESSVSPIDEAPVSPAPKSPLVLSPSPSAAPSPCEITINFLQRYEVRQVYVRSTSRVYEIYYSPKRQGDNDYLCTVRCGIAVKDQAPDVRCTGESSSACLRDTNEGLDEERCKDDNSNSNDDEWVQVKAPTLPADTDGSTSFLLKNNINVDFYEATAEISDAEPCVSLTLRLLSIQSGGCVYVDEVYVFVDPIDPNSESQEYKSENSAGSSLLSMLVPSLLQLSKSKGTSLLSEKGPSDSNGHQKQTRTGIEMTEQDELFKESKSASSSKVDKEEVKPEVANAESVEPTHQTSKNPYIERKPDAPYYQIETVLGQLVSRVSRIEDLFMRFEENMLRPISNIEARLQHVEQQLEALNEKTLNSGEHSCKRFLAPEYSPSDSKSNSLYGNGSEYHDSKSNSLYGNGSEYHDYGELEPDKKDVLDKLPVPHEDDNCDSEGSGQLLPCLKVTAPDFSHGDDEEENPVIEAQATVDSQKAKRQAVSIDDALASALAGFLSSTSIQPQKYSQSLAVRAPEFSNEDESYEENASSRVQFDASPDSSVSLNETDKMKLSEIHSACDVNYEDPFGEIGKECNNPGLPSKEENSNEARDMMDDAAKPNVGDISSHHTVLNNEDGEASTETSSFLVPNEYEASGRLSQTPNSLHHVEDELTNSACADSTACEVPKEDSEEDMLHNVLALSQSACTLDFEIPILDVKFVPQPDGTSKSVLEGLFGYSPGSDTAIPSDEGTLEASSSQCLNSFIELDDANQSNPAANSCFVVDVEHFNLQKVPVESVSEKPQDDDSFQYEESLAESLI